MAETGGKGSSYHHNLLCHHESRTPRLGPRPSTQEEELLDMRNNVIYNWAGNGCYGGEGMDVNIYNNYYKPGPATRKKGGAVQYRIAAINIRTLDYCTDDNGKPNGWYPMLHHWGKFYVDGNVIDGNEEVTRDNWTKGIYAQIDKNGNDGTFTSVTKDTMHLDAPLEFYATTTHTAQVAYEKVLQYARASLSRDAIDSIMVYDTRNNKASFTGGGGNLPGIINSQEDCVYNGTSAWPELKSETAPLDSDRDGMPDEWERENGLDPNDPEDRNKTNEEGYTMLEVYMNSLVADIMDGCTSDGELLGKIKDSANDPTPTDYEISQISYMSGDSKTWSFSDGYTITNAKNKGYAGGKNNTIKYSAGVPFTVTLPEGKRVTAVKIEGYANDDAASSYLSQLGDKKYTQSDGYTFQSRVPSIVMSTYDIPLEEPLTGSFVFSFGGAQQCAILTLTTENINTGGVVDVKIEAKDPHRLVDVYNVAGVVVLKQIRYSEAFTVLPQGFYIIDGEKVIIN